MNEDLTGRESAHEVLETASLAGHILLENGAEIARVEETMERIASHYDIGSRNFFVLSNGIFTTGHDNFAKVEFIPFKGAQLERVVSVNQVSRDICDGKFASLSDARKKLAQIRGTCKSGLEQIIGSAVGSAGFCIIFGGGLADAAAAFIAGLLLWVFVLFVSAPYMTKMVGNIIGGMFGTVLCILFYKAGFGNSLGNMIAGALIPLIPGVPFINGIRDLANEDYIAGITRLEDAVLVFLSIALGASLAFVADSWIEGSMLIVQDTAPDAFTSSAICQCIAAFLGTLGFAVLFGVPARHYLAAALCAAAGWLLYIFHGSTFVATASVALAARFFAVWFKAPETIFLIPGIFPLVPGGGIFRTALHLVSGRMHDAFACGWMSLRVTVAIVLGIVIVSQLPPAMFRVFLKRNKKDGSNKD